MLSVEAQEIIREACKDEAAYQRVAALFDQTCAEMTSRMLRERMRFRALYERTNDAMFIVDLDGHYLEANQRAAEVLGYESTEILGLHYSDLIPDEEREAGLEKLRIINSGVIPPVYERTFIRKDGSRFIAEINAALVYDDEDQPMYIQSLVRDITERKQIEQARLENERLEVAFNKERELNELKNKMMSRISHEFRTPLAVIQTSADILERYADRLSPEKRDRHFSQVRDQIRTLATMLDAIRFIVYGQTRENAFNPAQIELFDLSEQVIQQVCQNSTANFRLSNDSPSPHFVVADPVLLATAISCLLSNAVKYSPHGAVIDLDITTEANTNTTYLSITDNGIGIPQTDLTRIFDPFYRGANINEISGLGLGLTIAKNIIDLHSGDIWVESAVDQGSRFTLCLPSG